MVVSREGEWDVSRRRCPDDLKSRKAWWAKERGWRSRLSTMTRRAPGGPSVRSWYWVTILMYLKSRGLSWRDMSFESHSSIVFVAVTALRDVCAK